MHCWLTSLLQHDLATQHNELNVFLPTAQGHTKLHGTAPNTTKHSTEQHINLLYFCLLQAQLNMLVTGADACHLLSHTVRQDSAIFHIPLHKQWCNQMLHWVAKLNTEYVVPGLAPPANVFWEQPEYRQFVALTKEACKGLMKAAKGVPSVNRDGPGQQPIWLGHVEHLPPAAQVPVFREEGAPHLGQQPQLHQPQQQQPQVHQPQQQQQPQEGHFMQGLPEVDQAPESQYGLGVVPDTQDQQHDWEQHLPQQQQQQQPQSEQQQLSQWLHNQPQQQQQSQLNEQQRLGQWHQYRPQQPQQQQQQQRFGQWHQLYQDSRAGQLHIQQPQLQHMRQEQVVNGAASAALRHSASLTAAAAVALPADEDEPMPDAEPAAVAVPEAASAAAPPPAAAAGPGGQGPIGAHGLSSCIQRMLHKHKVNLGDVLDYTCQAALSLLTRVDVFGVLEKLAQEVKAGWPRNPSALCMQRIKACSAPRPDAAPHPPAPTAELATSGPVGTSPAPAGPTSNGPAVYSTTSPRRPFAEGPAQGPQSFVTPGPAVRTALPSLGFNSPSPLSSAPASPAPVRPSNGPAQGTFPINSPAAGRSVYHGSVYTTTAFNASAATSTIPATPVLARRAADDFAADQPVQPGTVRPVTVTAYAHGLSNSANGNRGSATAAAAPRSFSATAPVEPFTPQQVANLSEALKQQLYSLVRDHRCFVKASDFDVYIMKKLEAMTERQALHVLQQLDRVSWATVQDPTRYIMYFCCNRAG